MNFLLKSLKGLMLVVSIIFCVSTTGVFAEDVPVYLDNQQDIKSKYDIYEDVPVYLNNQKVTLSNGIMFDYDGIMLPVRAVCESLGYDVLWDDVLRTVTIQREGTIPFAVIRINSATILTRDIDKKMDVVPKIVDGRTYVKLQILQEILSDNLKWDIDELRLNKDAMYANVDSFINEDEEFNIKVCVPQIVNPTKGETVINRHYKDRANEEIENIKNTWGRGPADDFSASVNYEIKENSKDIFSVLSIINISVLDMQNGGMERTSYICDAFCKNTGDRLDIKDVLKGTQEDIEKIVVDAYKNGEGYICRDPYRTSSIEEIYCDEDYLISNYSFYVEGNDLVFFVGVPNGAAKWQKWMSTFKMNIDANKGLFTEEFLSNFDQGA